MYDSAINFARPINYIYKQFPLLKEKMMRKHINHKKTILIVISFLITSD